MKKNFSVIVFIFCCLEALPQDFHLSQYDVLTQFVNPALTGVRFDRNDGAYRFNTDYRSQWRSVASKPYSTFTVGFDMRTISKWNWGIYIINDRAGAGNLNTLKFLASGSYNVSVDDINTISAGFQAGFFQRSIAFGNYYFEDQYSVPAGGFDRSLSNNENFANNNIIRFDANFGIYYEMKDKNRIINPFAGVALFHLTRPNESFINAPESRLPFRYVVHGGFYYNASKELKVTPNLLLMLQKKATEINAGVILNYSLDNKDKNQLIGGVSFRVNDAVIIHAGYKYGPTTFRVSYDINISKLNYFTRSRGGYELSLVFTSPTKGISKFNRPHNVGHKFHHRKFKHTKHRR